MTERKAGIFSAGFGLERLGLLALKFPSATLAIILLITPLLAFSASQLSFSSDIREIFRSGSSDFTVLEQVSKQYPSSDRDIILVIEGPDLFQPDNLDSLRNLHLDLGLVEGVSYVLSMFSARKAPVGDATPEPLFPLELNDIEDIDALKRAVQAHPIVAEKLLSSDGNLAVFAVSFEDKDISVPELQKLIGEIRELASQDIDLSRFSLTFTGSSVMRVEIIDTLSQDQRVFGILGMTFGLVLCWVFFRELSFVVIAGAPAAVAVIWLLGTMRLIGQEVNVLTNIVPILVMVLVFSDGLHLLFAIRRNLNLGLDLKDAITQSVRNVGPACALTSATTTIALLSLTLVRHPFITGFGFTAALGTAIAYIAIMVTVPPIAFFLLKNRVLNTESDDNDIVRRSINALSFAAARMVHDHSKAIALIGLVITLAAGTLYSLNETRYRYLDNLPNDNPAYRAIQTIDEKLCGPNVLELLLQWPPGTKLEAASTLEVVKEAHKVLADDPIFRSISSLGGIATWYNDGTKTDQDFFNFLDTARSPTVARVFSPDTGSALLSANFSDLDAAELLPVLDKLNDKLDVLRRQHPEVEFSLTGIVPVSARASTEMIGQLNLSLLIAIAVIIGLIGLAFKSLMAGLASILPNLLPIAVAGAGLYLTGVGLQFTSVVAFTIGFGIAVDNTIHVLNRYRLAEQAGLAPPEAIEETIRLIGPVLMVATIVLVSGSVATFFSAMPVVRLYGYVSATLLATALIGGMMFLPAILRVAQDFQKNRGVQR